MRISFTKSQQEFEPILINGDALEAVDSVKLLGLNISIDSTWNIYINETVKNGSKRLYIFWYNLRELITGRKNGFTNVCERCKYVVNLELQICITFALSAKVWANTYIC